MQTGYQAAFKGLGHPPKKYYGRRRKKKI